MHKRNNTIEYFPLKVEEDPSFDVKPKNDEKYLIVYKVKKYQNLILIIAIVLIIIFLFINFEKYFSKCHIYMIYLELIFIILMKKKFDTKPFKN